MASLKALLSLSLCGEYSRKDFPVIPLGSCELHVLSDWIIVLETKTIVREMADEPMQNTDGAVVGYRPKNKS